MRVTWVGQIVGARQHRGYLMAGNREPGADLPGTLTGFVDDQDLERLAVHAQSQAIGTPSLLVGRIRRGSFLRRQRLKRVRSKGIKAAPWHLRLSSKNHRGGLCNRPGDPWYYMMRLLSGSQVLSRLYRPQRQTFTAETKLMAPAITLFACLFSQLLWKLPARPVHGIRNQWHQTHHDGGPQDQTVFGTKLFSAHFAPSCQMTTSSTFHPGRPFAPLARLLS